MIGGDQQETPNVGFMLSRTRLPDKCIILSKLMLLSVTEAMSTSFMNVYDKQIPFDTE